MFPWLRRSRPDAGETPRRLEWTPELVGRFWDGFAQTRLVEFSFSKQAGRSLLIAVDHLLPREGRILDFGAGDGYLIELMLQRGLKAAGYEPSSGRRRLLHSSLVGSTGFLGVVGNGNWQTFDVVLMAEVIEHILDKQLDATLKRLGRWTKPGGSLIVTTPNDEDLELGMIYCPVSNVLFHRWQHVRSFTRESLCALLDGYGFDEVVTHLVGFDDRIFVPHDHLWGNQADAPPTLDYMLKLRSNEATCIGTQSNILYIGRKRG
jgi:SAM-dependent methyltransferase